MALIVDAYTDCVMLDKRTAPDGRGGIIESWIDGAPFRAAIVKDDSLQARVAQSQGVSNVYTVTATGGVMLGYHDVFRRVEDGTVFRVTGSGKDKKPPDAASPLIKTMSSQVSAEEWTVPG